MQIIRRKSDNVALYAGADLTADEITNLGVGWCDSRVSVATCDVISVASLPSGYIDECWTYISGVWAVAAGKQSEVDALLGISTLVAPTISNGTAGAMLTSAGFMTSYVDITWAAVLSAESYEIRFALTTDANWAIWGVLDGNSSTNTYRIAGLLAGREYKFSIRAKCLWGVSVWSSDFTVTAALPGDLPANVSGFSGSFADNLVTLTWTLLDNDNVHSYEIRQGVTWSGATVIRTGEKAGKWSFRPSVSGTVTYLIKARDSIGNYSATAASTNVDIPIAAPPTALTTAAILFGIEVTVTHPNTADIDYCEVWASTTNDRAGASLIGMTRNAKFQHEGLGNAAIRYYWARTKNVFGEFSTYYPVLATAGVLGATIADPSNVIRLLNSGVDSTALSNYINGTGSFSDVLDTYTPAAQPGVGQTGVFATKGEILVAADRAIQLKAGDADMWSQITLVNAAIQLKASQTSLDTLTGTVATKAAQIDLDAANAAIQLKASSTELSAQVDILNNAIGLKLNATGTVGPGMLVSWTDGTHTRSVIDFWSDTFRISKPDGTGVKTIFTVGAVNGVSTVGINAGDLVVDGSILARHIAVGELIVGENVTMGAGATIQWANVQSRPTNLAGLDSTANTKLAGIAAGATNTTNTNQLTDGANLGGTAAWSGVSGAGKPADNATVGADWNTNVTNKPTIPTVPSYITSTKITATTIESPTISAGTFTGSQFILGNGTTYGKIETYDFANRSVGVQIQDGASPSLTIKGGTFTGSTIQTSASGERVLISQSSNKAHFYGDNGLGTSTIVELGTIGILNDGNGNAVATFGASGANVTGMRAHSNGWCPAAQFYTWGAAGEGATQPAVWALSKYGYGAVLGQGYLSGSWQDSGKAPLRLMPSTSSSAPTHSADVGALWMTSVGVIYVCTGTTNWQKVGAQ